MSRASFRGRSEENFSMIRTTLQKCDLTSSECKSHLYFAAMQCTIRLDSLEEVGDSTVSLLMSSWNPLATSLAFNDPSSLDVTTHLTVAHVCPRSSTLMKTSFSPIVNFNYCPEWSIQTDKPNSDDPGADEMPPHCSPTHIQTNKWQSREDLGKL